MLSKNRNILLFFVILLTILTLLQFIQSILMLKFENTANLVDNSLANNMERFTTDTKIRKLVETIPLDKITLF